ncbi:MAG: GGDEF domain-containing protein [Treponema sp.]|jgi:diguanylate cyclase (GGDEF)-like protein|nr:GGDEF domain-containing protein [Treponema sp.]
MLQGVIERTRRRLAAANREFRGLFKPAGVDAQSAPEAREPGFAGRYAGTERAPVTSDATGEKKGYKKKEEQLAEHIRDLLRRQELPDFPEELKTIPLAEDIHRELCEVRQVLKSYAAWDLDPTPKSAGILARHLKALKANFRHIVWRIQMALHGDVSSLEGLGAEPFNEIVRHLEQDLRAKEAEQRGETELRRTTDRQQATTHELQEREYRFRYLASRDPLTGALNRSCFVQRAMIELETAYAQKTVSCLAILDLNRFKQFNDRYGHPAGDEALKHMVEVVSGELRKTDFMGRYGGDEFVVFFPNTRLDLCRLVCERALKKLAATPVRLDTGSAVITASVGLAQTDGEERDGKAQGYPDFFEEWIYLLVAQADRALYQAKASGGERAVSCYGERDGAGVLDGPAQ